MILRSSLVDCTVPEFLVVFTILYTVGSNLNALESTNLRKLKSSRVQDLRCRAPARARRDMPKNRKQK